MADKTIIINGVTFGRGTGVEIDDNPVLKSALKTLLTAQSTSVWQKPSTP